ncbi:hypothetical protein IW150_005279 [Coemansia sp. RSA 2607]|nr:hypothetical protein IW150_005279 [Coemansia sp. RSA 2607]
MNLFDGDCAWFAPSVPASHVHAWLNDSGVQIKDARKSSIIKYYFSNSLDDDTTLELIRSPQHVVYRSTWIADSVQRRTKQPVGPYALNQRSSTVASAVVHASPVTSVRAHIARRSGFSPHQHRQDLQTPYRRPRSVAGITNEFYSPTGMSVDRYLESLDETRSIASSRHSGASSIISGYGRRQHIVSRFVINADEQTRASILTGVADFTPNENGFVAYKIPKLTS